MAHPFFGARTPLSIGHRGCAGEAPENTLAAFARGVLDGADVLESDVHLTSDGVPVLIHDAAVDRCTNGHGPVEGFTLEALQALDAGYHFRSGDQRGQGHRIPTLREVLSAFPSSPLNLELKAETPALVDRCLDIVSELDAADRVLLTAENDAVMLNVRAQSAARRVPVALGACLGDVVSFVRAATGAGSPVEGPMALQIPAHFGDRPLATPELVAYAHGLDVQVHVWTINEPAEIRSLLDLGVDGIVSDYPARVVAAREERQ